MEMVLENATPPRVPCAARRRIAACLRVADSAQRQLGVYLVNGYAPHSGSTDAEWDEYYACVAVALSKRPPGYVLVMFADCNASVGRASAGDSCGAVGPHGLDHVNAAGRRLRSFMELHELAALTTFKRKRWYGTWQHPRSRLQHQIDHIIVLQCDVKRFTDAACMAGQLIDSDHRAVGCMLKICVHLARPSC